MAEEIPLRPVGRQDIHKLETALLIATLLRPDVIEEIKKAEERLTWVDSLAVAAAALARSKAGMNVSQIAEELGRSEGTIRNHLQAKTKAGKLIQETYQKFLREGVRIEIPEAVTKLASPEIERYRKEVEELREKLKKLEEEKVKNLEEQINSLRSENEKLREEISKYKEKIERIKEILSE